MPATVEATMDASPEAVWRVLADGWLYPLWVVGATRMREVDDTWPAVGSRIHHSVGTWPITLDDHTEVLGCTPGEELELRARAWPTGEAVVKIHLRAEGAGTRVSITEDAARGPALLMPAPIRKASLVWRNRETLRRLGWVAERRSQRGS